MPLDILIDTGRKENAKPIMLFLEEYDSIMEILEKEAGVLCPIRNLSLHHLQNELQLSQRSSLAPSGLVLRIRDTLTQRIGGNRPTRTVDLS